MPNLQLVCDGTSGRNASFIIQDQESAGTSRPATGTATIDNYSAAFLVNVGADDFQIVPKITMAPGQPTITVTATFNCTDTTSGNAMPPLTVAVDLIAPPALVVTAGPTAGVGSDATDPGSATISVTLA